MTEEPSKHLMINSRLGWPSRTEGASHICIADKQPINFTLSMSHAIAEAYLCPTAIHCSPDIPTALGNLRVGSTVGAGSGSLTTPLQDQAAREEQTAKTKRTPRKAGFPRKSQPGAEDKRSHLPILSGENTDL
jgi:hypothetical protein